MENSDKRYTGIEVNFVKFIFKRLNLTVEYNVSPNTKDTYYRIFMQTVGQIEPASSDIAVGVLPLHSGTIRVAEATIPYFIQFSWYVPWSNLVSRSKSMYIIFGSLVWTYFSAVAILDFIIMWLLAKFESHIHVRESANYKTLIYFTYNLWAVLTEYLYRRNNLT
jgi:hypothetical protein